MAIYTVKLKRQPKEGDTINQLSNFKFFKAPTILAPHYDTKLKRYLTGLDSDDPEIALLPNKEESTKEKKRRDEKKKSLETVTGVQLGGLNSEYWDNFAIELYQGRVFDTDSPYDDIAITCLKRKGNVAFGRDEIWKPECNDIEFYLETAEGAKLGNSAHRRKKTRAIGELGKLLDNRERLFNISYFLNLSPGLQETMDELEDKLTLFLESDPDNVEKFISACVMDNEKISNINLFRKATKLKIVDFEPVTKLYFRGNMNYKNTIETSVDFLMLAENRKEIEEIAEAVARKERGKLIYA